MQLTTDRKVSLTWASGLSLALAWGGIARAQQGKATELPEPQAAGLASRPLLLEPVVQREIGLTARQRQSLANIETEVADARQSLVTPDEREVDFNTLLGGVENVERERGKAIARILTPAQKNRLNQLQWQRDGWLAINRPEVAARLKLKPDQSRQIRAIVDQMRQDQAKVVLGAPVSADGKLEPVTTARPAGHLNPRNGFIDPTGGDADGGPLNFTTEGMAAQEKRSTEALGKVQRAAARAVDEILSTDQKAAFLELLGPHFDDRTLDPNWPAPAASAPRASRSPRK